jgi:hypothetical protein
VSVIAASLFYTQNKQQKQKVQELIQTLESQETLPTPTLTPTPEITPLPTLASDPEATPEATPTVEEKSIIKKALDMAQEKYSNAQLILITATNPQLPDQGLTKYWFRQAPDTKKYLYISYQGGELNLVDKQIYVSPDNNIPSLNQRIKEDKLGLDQDQVIQKTSSLCQADKCQQSKNIDTQFLDTGTNLLWQVTYKFEDQSAPTIFQIDSLTEEVIYRSQK